MIERLERTKVVLYKESLSSIAADGIVLPALLYTIWSCSCAHIRAARARGLRRIRVIQNRYKN
jgi:hypothetical protein